MNKFMFNVQLEKMKKAIKNALNFTNLTHITHTDLDGVSCGVVSNIPKITSVTYTGKMVPALYNVIENAVHHHISYYAEENEAYIIISDFGSITVENLYNTVYRALERYKVDEDNDLNLDYTIHFVVVDHHQSKYYGIEDSEITSATEYKQKFGGVTSDYFTVTHNEDTTLVRSRKDHNGIKIFVDMYLSTKFSAAKLLYNLAVSTNSVKETDCTKEYFDMVSTYDTGNMGNFMFNRDFLVGEPKEIWEREIMNSVSPQMILNAALYSYIDSATEDYQNDDIYSDYAGYRGLLDGIAGFLNSVVSIFNNYVEGIHMNANKYWHFCPECNRYIDSEYPDYVYDINMDTDIVVCPHCQNKKLVITRKNTLEKFTPDTLNHVWKSLVGIAVKRLNKMMIAYEQFVLGYHEVEIDNQEYMYFEDNHIRYGMKFPKGKFRVLYRIYPESPDSGVSINVFAKKYMEYRNSKKEHIDLSIVIYSNREGTLKKCSLTQNPMNGANCYEIAALNDGGGHIGAAGFTMTDYAAIDSEDEYGANPSYEE